MNRLTEERDLLLEQKHHLSENINSYIEQIQEEKYRYQARVNILLEENDKCRARINGLLEETDLLKHILSINNIQLTTEVVQDALNHLRELTKEMIE